MSIHEEVTRAAVTVLMPVFNNLVLFDQHKEKNSLDTIVPDLTESWTWSEDGKELTFKLRHGVKWHDGKPFTAADVKCTWDLLQGKTQEKLRLNPRKAWYRNLEEVTTKGDDEVTFHLKRPQPYLLVLLASGVSPVYPCHVSPAQMRQHPIGTGPFKFVEYKPNKSVRLTRNPDYWKPGRPYLDGLEFPIVASVATRNLMFIADNVDMTLSYGVSMPLLRDIRSQVSEAICTTTTDNGARNLIAASGRHVWAERYDRALDDIFAVQDEITLSVVGYIEPSLRQAEIERAKRKRPDSLDAYDLYLRALPYAMVFMPGDADKALPLLRQSLELEPCFAAAHAAAAWCHEQRYLRGGLDPVDKTAALAHAGAALEAGADDAATLATAGFVGLVDHDYDTAMNAIARGLAMTPSSALALSLGSVVLGHSGRTAKAIDYAERALRWCPLDRTVSVPYVGLGIAHCAAGDWEAAVPACGKSEQANPERRGKPTPALWPAAAARRGATRCGQRRRDRSFSCRTNQLDSAELVIKMQRRHLDGDVGNSGRKWREASAERFEIGQFSGVELGIDGLREFRLHRRDREPAPTARQ